MPPRDVTIHLDRDAKPTPEHPELADNAGDVLRAAVQETTETSEIVKASFVGVHPQEHKCAGNHSGLIMTVLEAHNNHRHLVLCPDDIKVAVLIQIAGRLWRDYASVFNPWLVDPSKPDPTKALEIHVKNTIHPDNHETVATTVILKLLEQAPKHSHPYDTKALLGRVLERTMIPPKDRERMVSTDHLFGAGSIPSVTMLGKKSDWEKLSQYFQTLRNEYPRPVCYDFLAEYLWDLTKLSEYFVKSFDNHEDKDIILFWNRMCPKEGRKGWLAAFNRFDQYGIEVFSGNCRHGDEDIQHLDIPCGDLLQTRVCPGYRLLDFLVDDGETTTKLVKYAVGSVGTHFSSSKPNGHPLDTVQPMSGYFIYKR